MCTTNNAPHRWMPPLWLNGIVWRRENISSSISVTYLWRVLFEKSIPLLGGIQTWADTTPPSKSHRGQPSQVAQQSFRLQNNHVSFQTVKCWAQNTTTGSVAAWAHRKATGSCQPVLEQWPSCKNSHLPPVNSKHTLLWSTLWDILYLMFSWQTTLPWKCKWMRKYRKLRYIRQDIIKKKR